MVCAAGTNSRSHNAKHSQLAGVTDIPVCCLLSSEITFLIVYQLENGFES